MILKTRDIKELSLEELLMARSEYHSQSPFGRRLKEMRQTRGLTQIELAKIVGGTQKMITHYENRVKFPPVDMIPKLAKALKVSADELLGIKPLKDGDLPKNKNLLRRFTVIGKLPLRDQRSIFSFINALNAKQAAKAHSTR